MNITMTPKYKILMISVAVAAIIGIPVSFADISTTNYGLDSLSTKLTEIITQVNSNTNQLGNMTSSEITGEIKLYSGSSTPTGYLLADGSAVSRTTYSDLFAVVGTTYGAGDGSTTFNLPDLVQKFARGGTSGNTGGADTVTLTISEMPSHNHGITDPGHTHSVNTSNGLAGLNAESANGSFPGSFLSGSSTTGITINNAGGGNAHENLPSYLEILYIIKY